MRLLIDTHLALWSIQDDPRLSEQARETISAAAPDAYVSVVSLWEIAIKHALRGPRRDPILLSAGQVLDRLLRSGFRMLAVTPEHAIAVDGLPQLHGDPFDRLIVAQAVSEPMRLLTRDARLKPYSQLVTLV